MEYGPVRTLCGDEVSDCNTIKDLEASNLPAVLICGVGKWPAISRWDPAKGGLRHLKSLAGSTIVQVAVSFGGFIDRITLGAKAVTGCSSPPPEAPEGNDSVIPARGIHIDEVNANIEITRREGDQAPENGAFDPQLYLAQGCGNFIALNRYHRHPELFFADLYWEENGSIVPIFSKEAVHESTLSTLMEDIEMPLLLKTTGVSDVNLWMSMTDSRSSTHYDPYHNLLCVVSGEKKVTLWPPSAAPFLYPLPINGEASNHSGVDFVQPDYKAHPLFHKALSVAQLVTLCPGDALFIPEGWYHQVDSFGVTIAVNFWWPSKVSSALGTHMDAYFLRRILVNLVDQEKDRMLGEDIAHQRKSQQPLPVTGAGKSPSGRSPGPKHDDNGETFSHSVEESQNMNFNNVNNEELADIAVLARSGSTIPPQLALKLEDLTALETYNLNCVVESLTRKNADTPDITSKASQTAGSLEHGWQASKDCNGSNRDVNQDNSKETSWEGVSDHSRTDSIARVFSTSTALCLQRLLLVMANHFPRMLERLMLRSLSPSAAEILTRKFEELDASTDQSSQAAFYEQFYKAFESPDAVMESLLNGKEAFAAQALRNVLTQYLGIECSHGSPSR